MPVASFLRVFALFFARFARASRALFFFKKKHMQKKSFLRGRRLRKFDGFWDFLSASSLSPLSPLSPPPSFLALRSLPPTPSVSLQCSPLCRFFFVVVLGLGLAGCSPPAAFVMAALLFVWWPPRLALYWLSIGLPVLFAVAALLPLCWLSITPFCRVCDGPPVLFSIG